MKTPTRHTKLWLCLALLLSMLAALPSSAFAQPSEEAKQRLAAALPGNVTPDTATAEQLEAAVAAALSAGGITPKLAGEIVEYALGLPGIQNLLGEEQMSAGLGVMRSALEAAPPGEAFANSITLATVFVMPALAVEVNAERARRNMAPLSNAIIGRTVRQPFEGNPPEGGPTPTPRGRRPQGVPPGPPQGVPPGPPQGLPPGPPQGVPPPVEPPMTPKTNSQTPD